MQTEDMKIGEAAKASGVPVSLIRYYASIGLVSKPKRIASGSRHYTQEVVDLLRFITRAQKLAFSIDQIRRLVAPWHSGRRSAAADTQIALEHIADLHARMTSMHVIRDALQGLAHRRPCANSNVARIAKKLASDLSGKIAEIQTMSDTLAGLAVDRDCFRDNCRGPWGARDAHAD